VLSILTPIDLSRRSEQILRRVRRLLLALQGTEIEVVFGHADRGGWADSKLIKLVSTYEGRTKVILCSVPTSDLPSNLSNLRNEAARAMSGDIVLLLDIDIFPDIALFRYMEKRVSSDNLGICMVPCAYLSEEGSVFILKGGNSRTIVEQFYDFRTTFIMHWACPSSITAFRSEDYWNIGGFFEGYKGHGYEDFDFILRLALYKLLIPRGGYLLIDKIYRAPGFSVGFRSVLAKFCIENIFDSKVAFHLFHRKDYKDIYYLKRTNNRTLFLNRFQSLLSASDSNDLNSISGLPFFTAFFNECMQRGLSFDKYHALFDARPRYALIKKTWFSLLVKVIRDIYNRIARSYD
jgi:predicted glycosyltransferase involved in capsule biosynthesis